MRHWLCIIGLLLVVGSQAVQAPADGWWLPSLGAGRGNWQLSTGAFVWPSFVRLRNLQLRGDVDLAPGLRVHTLIRSNDEFQTLRGFAPRVDENFLEAYGFRYAPHGVFSASLRIGETRYLRFPYPDAIALFDQVQGVADLQKIGATGYSGELLTLDYAHDNGLGAHLTGLRWDFSRPAGSELIESYLSLRRELGPFSLESRVGRLAVRQEPLGRGAPGGNLYLGVHWKGYTAGVLYEHLHGQKEYTGVAVQFTPTIVTQAMGAVSLDYDRSPEGFALQLPLLHGAFGIRHTPPATGKLVGEITAERIHTYWQNGHSRNYYEHRLSSWGETGRRDLVVVEQTEPWYLQAEALVSPNTHFTSWNNLKTWEHERQGPAQQSQRVTYRFYAVTPPSLPAPAAAR